jgi:hypothetical protein
MRLEKLCRNWTCNQLTVPQYDIENVTLLFFATENTQMSAIRSHAMPIDQRT